MDSIPRATLLALLALTAPLAGCVDLDGPAGPGEDPPGITAQQALDRMEADYPAWVQEADLVWLNGEESADNAAIDQGPIGDGELASWTVVLWNTTAAGLLVATVPANGSIDAQVNPADPTLIRHQGRPSLGTFAVDSDQAARVVAEHDSTAARMPADPTSASYRLAPIRSGGGSGGSQWLVSIEGPDGQAGARIDALEGTLLGLASAAPRDPANRTLGTLTVNATISAGDDPQTFHLQAPPGQAAAEMLVAWPVTQWPDGVELSVTLDDTVGQPLPVQQGPGWRSASIRATGDGPISTNLTVTLDADGAGRDAALPYWVQIETPPGAAESIPSPTRTVRIVSDELPAEQRNATHAVDVRDGGATLFVQAAWDGEDRTAGPPAVTLAAGDETVEPGWALTGQHAVWASFEALDAGAHELTVAPAGDTPADGRYHLRLVQASP